MTGGFTLRSCPACGCTESDRLLEPDAQALFASNWSYRREAADRRPASPDRFPIVACRACGFTFASLAPTEAFNRWVYDDLIDGAAAQRANLDPRSMAWKMTRLGALLQLSANGRDPVRVLDLGCGFGPSLRLLSAMPSVHALGFDTSCARIAALRSLGLRATSDWREVEAAAPFDAIVLDNVLEHLPDPAGLLASMGRCCAPGAIVFASVPDASGAQHPRGIASAGAALPMAVNPWEHLNYFDLAFLDRFMRQAGFDALPASELPTPVDIGLRPSTSLGKRLANAAASLVRLTTYALKGEAVASTTTRFYRRTDEA